MHSDESWLAGLTREIAANGAGGTEPFFNLLPRYPHAIKLLFHAMQMPLIAALGYSLFAVRLISLLFGAAALCLFYNLALRFTQRRWAALGFAVALSLDVQFVYAAHMARQDIVIAFGILAAMLYILKNLDAWGYRKDLVLGALVGVFIGVHPNSLMVALCAGALYLYAIVEKKLRVRNLLLLIGTVSCFAALFVGISLSLDPGFFAHYARYGSELGVTLTLLQKLKSFPEYFLKLFLQVSGTYYTPFIKPQLVLFAAGALALAVCAFFRRDALKLLLPLLALNAGFVAIGRYSQPAVILLFPVCYLVLVYLSELLPKRAGAALLSLFGATVAAISFLSVRPYLNDDYKNYLAQLDAHVPAGAKTLANLNGEFAFERGTLLDYRNLAYLEERGLTFEEYVEGNGIEYIVYPAEMDFIYMNRPVYNILYGNLSPYYGDMRRFLDENCTLAGAFDSPYAMRIPKYMYDKEWEVRVYRVESEGEE